MNPSLIFEIVYRRLLNESEQQALALVVKDWGQKIDAVLYDTQVMLNLLHELDENASESEIMSVAKTAMRGFVQVSSPGKSLGDCLGAWEISKIAGPGFSQVLHSAAAALSPNGLIMTDRYVLSKGASKSFRVWSADREKVKLPPKCITAPREPGGVLDLGEDPRKGLDPSENPEHLNYAYRASQEDEDILYDLSSAHFEMKRDQFVSDMMNNYGLDFFDDMMDKFISR